MLETSFTRAVDTTLSSLQQRFHDSPSKKEMSVMYYFSERQPEFPRLRVINYIAHKMKSVQRCISPQPQQLCYFSRQPSESILFLYPNLVSSSVEGYIRCSKQMWKELFLESH